VTCDIFIRSYEKDFEWLKYCLRSIKKFAFGFRRIIVVVPNGQNPPTGVCETVFFVHENCPGYYAQQISKLHADQFSDADYFLFIDSDTIFIRNVNPINFISPCGRVNWYYTPRVDMGEYSDAWREVAEIATGEKSENEFMRFQPMIVPRFALELARSFFWKKHGMSIETYAGMQTRNRFSEFNILGSLLWKHRHDDVIWLSTSDGYPDKFAMQSRSWSGLSDEIKREMEAVLA
jgi:hypothetical protein